MKADKQIWGKTQRPSLKKTDESRRRRGRTWKKWGLDGRSNGWAKRRKIVLWFWLKVQKVSEKDEKTEKEEGSWRGVGVRGGGEEEE